MLKRKIDKFLLDWKNRVDKKPLIISGARQIGKTTSIREFGKTYKSFIEINFVSEPYLKRIFENGYDTESIIRSLSLFKPDVKFINKDTLIFFDEIQEYPDAITSFKFFSLDGRFDVIASGSMLGINYKRISSIPVGFKEEYRMFSLDFEEYLWGCGYSESFINDIFLSMKELKPLKDIFIERLNYLFNEYIFVGGMPKCVDNYLKTKLFNEVFSMQLSIYKDYEDDITKYVEGLDMAKVKNIYRHISSQLSKDNHKFQVTQLKHGARFREYSGLEERLYDAGIINIAYNLENLKLPFASYESKDNFRIYYADHSLFIATLDEEAKKDLIINGNFNIYNGALYESLVSEGLVKSGYKTYFYKTKDAQLELDFVIRVKNEIVPIEVKRSRGKSVSLNTALSKCPEINYGIKLTNGNIGFKDNVFTFPYYLTFLLKRFFEETDIIKRK